MIYSIPTAQPTEDLKRIVDYLLTFVGEIQIKTKTATSTNIFYNHITTPSTLTLKSDKIKLNCSPDDNLSVTLIKNLSLRIYHSRLKAFFPNNPNLLDLSTIKIDNNILKIFKKYQLKPLFRYHHSLVFFAKDKQNQIHLINRHFLEYLINHPQQKLYPKEFSTIVAKDINRFIALIDRGLIPISFYQYLNKKSKIVNLSGLNIDKLTRKIMVEKITFLLDYPNQTFIQNASNTLGIIRGQSLIKQLKIKNFLAIKIAQDISYDIKNKTLIPKLKVLVFMDK